MTDGVSHWNQARLDLLARLWERGDSASEIGNALGVTRSTVLAKARRIGLTRKTGDENERFERLVDYVADAPLNHPVSIARAAIRVGILPARALVLWRELAMRLGERDIARDPEAGNRLVRCMEAA